MALRNDQKLLLGAALLSIALWVVPYLRLFLLPLTYFNTHIHELCHALAAVMTGGQVQHIIVNANGSGETPIAGGHLFLIASAGYVGSSVAGSLMILGSRTEKNARRTLWTIFGLLAFSMVIFVRGDQIGVLTGIFWAAVFGLAAKFLKKDTAIFIAQFFGVALCLNALQSILVLLNISVATETHSDAMLMQQATYIPAVFWALAWAGLSVLAIWGSLRSAWAPAKNSTPYQSRNQ